MKYIPVLILAAILTTVVIILSIDDYENESKPVQMKFDLTAEGLNKMTECGEMLKKCWAITDRNAGDEYDMCFENYRKECL